MTTKNSQLKFFDSHPLSLFLNQFFLLYPAQNELQLVSCGDPFAKWQNI